MRGCELNPEGAAAAHGFRRVRNRKDAAGFRSGAGAEQCGEADEQKHGQTGGARPHLLSPGSGCAGVSIKLA